MIYYFKVVLMLLCTCAVLVVVGCEKKASPLEKLLAEDGTEIKGAQDELVAARKELVGELIAIIREKENRVRKKPSVEAAMFVLGEMRAVECVELLVENIGFPYVREPDSEPRPGPRGGMGTIVYGLKGIQKVYPGVEALIKIGEPCLGTIIRKLSSTGHVTEKKACLAVLVALRGRSTSVALLKEGIGRETDLKKRYRLQRSLDMLVEIKE